MLTPQNNKYLLLSCAAHVVILLIFIISFNLSSTLPVFENTNQHDVISAVVLGDTPKSKILPQKLISLPQPAKPLPKPVVAKPKIVSPPPVDKEAIALKKAEEKKKLAEKQLELKKELEKKRRELFAKDLLADIKKTNDKHKKLKQKNEKSQFEKLLREQAEQSLRQQLLNEEIKLQGNQARYSQGVVNKYKALILQAISEHWIVPLQVNKSLTCELMIRVAPGGTVLDVQVTKSSGDTALDSSARAAVLKASPLPVPSEANDFEAFRSFVLKVKPENILANGNNLTPG